jgi:hypothetical protein
LAFDTASPLSSVIACGIGRLNRQSIVARTGKEALIQASSVEFSG